MRSLEARKRESREERFAREYILDLNATRAAIAAGLAAKSAAVEASKLLRKPKVQALIAALTKDKLEKLDISANWVLGELRKLAGYDAGAIFNDDGSLKPIKEWDASVRAALVGLDHDKLFEHFGKGQAKHVGATVKVKLADKLRALELLGKYLKLFTDKVEFDATANFTEALARVLERKRGQPTGSH